MLLPIVYSMKMGKDHKIKIHENCLSYIKKSYAHYIPILKVVYIENGGGSGRW
jgi:hypothetical protein